MEVGDDCIDTGDGKISDVCCKLWDYWLHHYTHYHIITSTSQNTLIISDFSFKYISCLNVCMTQCCVPPQVLSGPVGKFVRHISICGILNCAHEVIFSTWMFYHKSCRGLILHPNDLPQCASLYHCPCPPFHTPCICVLSSDHLGAGFHFSPSLS